MMAVLFVTAHIQSRTIYTPETEEDLSQIPKVVLYSFVIFTTTCRTSACISTRNSICGCAKIASDGGKSVRVLKARRLTTHSANFLEFHTFRGADMTKTQAVLDWLKTHASIILYAAFPE